MSFVMKPSSDIPNSGSSPQTTQNDRFDLEGRLEFDTAATALQAITAEWGRSNHLTLNMAGITVANSAGLAVLVECLSMARQSGRSVTFENIPESLQKIAEVCQVQDLLA